MVEDYLFDKFILAVALVFELEVVAEDAGYTLPESRNEFATKFLNNLIRSIFRLAVDKFAEYLTLVEGHSLD